MSAAHDRLVEIGIHNAHDVIRLAAEAGKGPGVYVSYRTEERGRAYRPAAWQVIRPGYKTDPDGHWRDGNNKTWTVNGRAQREPMKVEAVQWASKRYGIDGWGTITGLPGDLFPLDVSMWVRDRLRDALNARRDAEADR